MTTPTDDIVIVAAARTPQGRLKGQLASFTAPQLGGLAIAGALAKGNIPADAVDAVIGRCQFQRRTRGVRQVADGRVRLLQAVVADAQRERAAGRHHVHRQRQLPGFAGLNVAARTGCR